MSSGRINLVDGGGGSEQYFCHQCQGIISITRSRLGNITCPICNSGFVQEFRNPTQIRSIFSDDPDGDMDLIIDLTNNPLPSSAGFESSLEGSNTMYEMEDFDPRPFLVTDLSEQGAGGGISDFVIQDYDDGPIISSPTSNTGDYFNGPGFEEFIQQLPVIEPICSGPPPASRRAVERMPDVVVDEKMLKSDLAQCAVCQDDFERGTTVKQMPCKHSYHNDCILPWLELHNSCPVCRYELPTDDPDYESRSLRDTSRDPGGSEISIRSPHGPIRWFTLIISLPCHSVGCMDCGQGLEGSRK